MKAIKKSEPYKFRDLKMAVWNYDRMTMLQAAAVVTVAALAVGVIFMSRKKLLNAILNSDMYHSGVALTHKVADTAGAVTHKIADTASAVTHKVMDTASAVTHKFAGVSSLN